MEKRYWKEVFYKMKPEKRKREPHGVKKAGKVQDFKRLHQAKLNKILGKRKKKQVEREFQRRIRAVEEPKELVHFSTCQALNRLERPCKSKVLDKSNFCKIHQFIDSSSGLVQCMGTNKRLKRCIKSVLTDEQYCSYHKNKAE
ncbi:hypothetical protein OS493_028008 [Desmophyllum pertusum]|uniref:Uncharacterized protein n=1 Tax=Desmophyllum pertusum TaxID=174260 RepID=A0A9W9ZY13_9CNID|nr:hypothetical protein OS493_028008 [Desmophyllum pertusum]